MIFCLAAVFEDERSDMHDDDSGGDNDSIIADRKSSCHTYHYSRNFLPVHVNFDLHV